MFVLASIPSKGDSEGKSTPVKIPPPLNWEGKAENADCLHLTLGQHEGQHALLVE